MLPNRSDPSRRAGEKPTRCNGWALIELISRYHNPAPTLPTAEVPMRSAVACLLTLSLAAPALAQKEYGFDNRKPSGQPYLSPQESLKRMKVADGWEIHLAAAEPDIINPIAFTVDEKGRLWVVECFEYPSKTPPGRMPRDRIK